MDGGWIGVDLDATLAEYHGWNGGEIGKPIAPMVARVRRWLEEGTEVRIFTARVARTDAAEAAEQRALIDVWCVAHIGQTLPITATKDFTMLELWDDRCVQVIPNTGQPVTSRE